ncbi:hypothetical protein D5018_20085 [Parashewanella curva]|uniref:Uncharacterized protein n=1 Tax=Parashewanella curva TaxID=2338552 RepID=A0A3L8PTH2_9GAMM|nr:hypothetical protein [Parashewanella curva]RLV57903.1 hypothetical protein D5018_20085 [Parashewanella curva]
MTKGITGTPYGEFFNVDFASQTLNVGNYWSIQGGPDIGIRPLASADASLELTLYFDGGNYTKSLTGPFFAEGAEGAFGLGLGLGLGFGFGFETVQALQPKGQRFVEGVSLSLAVGSADLSGHAQFGYGGVHGKPQPIPFADVPSYFFHRWTNGVFK